ncbi:MAG: hypothetical protein ACR2HB_09450 [Dehalococcoidia bacterium]
MTSLVPRSDRYVKQPTGYRAFIPTPLPPAVRQQTESDTDTQESGACG